MHIGKLSPSLLGASAILLATLGCHASVTEPDTVAVQVRVFALPEKIGASDSAIVTAEVSEDGMNAPERRVEFSTTLGVLGAGGSDVEGHPIVWLHGDGRRGTAVVTARVVGTGVRAQLEVPIGVD